jgi:2-dehydropantoate 2-reductase
MKIGIVGAGAMGKLFGGMLAKAGEEVWLIDNHTERAEEINRKGVVIERGDTAQPGEALQEPVKVKATAEPGEVGPCELVILLVKAYDTEGATHKSLPLRGEGTVWLTLQNGLGNIEKIRKIVGKESVVAGITYLGATVLDATRIRYAAFGKTVIGEIDGRQTDRIKRISDIFNKAGIETEISDNIEGMLWGKLLINGVINPLTAILQVKNGLLLESPYLREIMGLVVEETARVAIKKGIKLPYANPLEKVEESCQASRENISSMHQDILRKKRTEIDFINGVIATEGEKVGVPTPLNKTLWNLVKFLEGRGENVE